MSIKLEATCRLAFGTARIVDGAATAADSTPVVSVAEQGTIMGYAPTVTSLATGLYEVAIVCSAANGFEVGKEYTAWALVVMGGVTSRESIGAFSITTYDVDSSESTLASAIAGVQSDTDDIQTRLPSALVGGKMDSTETVLEGRLTSTRAGYLDNLNVGGLVAAQADVTAIQNNTRCVRVVPDIVITPSAGTRTYRVELLLYDEVGNMEAPDAAPTLTLVNQAGTDRSARLDSATMALVSTGRYRCIYTSTAGDTEEQLVWAFSVVEGGATRQYGNGSSVQPEGTTGTIDVNLVKILGTPVPAPTVAGIPLVEVSSVATDAIQATSYNAFARAKLFGLVYEGSVTSADGITVVLNSGVADDDAYNGGILHVLQGVGAGSFGLVLDYVGSTRTATLRAPGLVVPPTDGDNSSIVQRFEVTTPDDVWGWIIEGSKSVAAMMRIWNALIRGNGTVPVAGNSYNESYKGEDATTTRYSGTVNPTTGVRTRTSEDGA